MSVGHSDIAWSRQLNRNSAGHVALWTAAALAVMSVHAGAAWWVMRERPMPVMDDAAPAIMIDLASMAMAPSSTDAVSGADAVDSVEAEAVEGVDTAEPVETVEPVEAVEPVREMETAEPVEAEPVTATAEPLEAEIVEAEPVETALLNMPVDPTLPEEIAPVETAEVAAVRAEVIEPEETVELPPDAVIPVPQARPERPVQVARQEQPKREQPRKERPQPQRQDASRQQTRAQVQAAQPAERVAAPQSAGGAGSSVSPARWQSRVMAHLERRKRYPAAAKRKRQEGTAQVRFTIDGNGNVGSVALARSSGVAELDAEVVALIRRASPVPAPPPGVNRTIVVPIRFNVR